MTWRPIDLAPRDGTQLVVLFRSPLSGAVSVALAHWSRDEWRDDSDDKILDVAFAWAELPIDMAED